MVELSPLSIQETLLTVAPQGVYTPLKTVKRFLRLEGNPHEALSIFHVAGTNGKGSCCAMIAQTLYKQWNKNVGLFVSPHVITCNERVQINGEYISDDDLLRHAIMLLKKAKKHSIELGYFALFTLVAIYYFVEKQIDYAVFEVGVGGKLDTTNLWDRPIATIISSIGFDHVALLGPTLAQIQRNKMGIMKSGVPCYTPVDNRLMHRGARRKNALLHIVNDKQKTNLLGSHQQTNAALVYRMLTDCGFEKSRVAQGLLEITHPGRLTFLNKKILVDAAHNAEGFIALQNYIQSIRPQYKKIISIFGTTKSLNEITESADHLLVCDEHYCVTPSFLKKNTATIDQYRTLLPYAVNYEPSLYVLLQRLLSTYKDDAVLIVLYGSVYLVADCYKCISGDV